MHSLLYVTLSFTSGVMIFSAFFSGTPSRGASDPATSQRESGRKGHDDDEQETANRAVQGPNRRNKV